MHNIELLTIVSAALNIDIGHCIEEYIWGEYLLLLIIQQKLMTRHYEQNKHFHTSLTI
jgi:hypothetical protein